MLRIGSIFDIANSIALGVQTILILQIRGILDNVSLKRGQDGTFRSEGGVLNVKLFF
jgi:hypothetical protein